MCAQECSDEEESKALAALRGDVKSEPLSMRAQSKGKGKGNTENGKGKEAKKEDDKGKGKGKDKGKAKASPCFDEDLVCFESSKSVIKALITNDSKRKADKDRSSPFLHR